MLIEYLYYYDNGEMPVYAKKEIGKATDHINYCNLQAKARSKVVAYDHFGCGIYNTDTGELWLFAEMTKDIKNKIDELSGGNNEKKYKA